MTEAMTYIAYFFTQFRSFLFSSALIQTGVSLGWVLVALIVMDVVIRSVLNLPASAPSFRGGSHVDRNNG